MSVSGFCVTGKGIPSRKKGTKRARVLASQEENKEEERKVFFLNTLHLLLIIKKRNWGICEVTFILLKHSKMDRMKRNSTLSIACKKRLIEQTCSNKFSFPRGENKPQQWCLRDSFYMVQSINTKGNN